MNEMKGSVVRRPVSLTVNGQLWTIVVEAQMTLLDALREELALTGAKKGCDRGECGACTVQGSSCRNRATAFRAGSGRPASTLLTAAMRKPS